MGYEFDPRLDKWKRWLSDINLEVAVLLDHRKTYNRVIEIVNSNPDIQKQNHFFLYLVSWYTTSTLFTIRRQTSFNKNSKSLARILLEVQEYDKSFSKKWFSERFERIFAGFSQNYKNEILISEIDKDFKKYSDPTNSYVDISKIKSDFDKLISLYKPCKKYVDKALAHMDKNPPKEIPTFKNLNDCIDFIHEATNKYNYLFSAGSYSHDIAHLFSLEEIFKKPWLKDLDKITEEYDLA